MPRELYLISTEPVTTEALVEAAVTVDGGLVPRTLLEGWAVQLVDAADVAVVTVERSRQVDDAFAVERIIGRQLPVSGKVWWTEATAPWGDSGEPGVAIISAVAEGLRGWLVVEDGT